ncbi:nucleotidyltransferase family protein [Rubrivirga sp.]|uniref:nucleotidyltransferase family protein n=1 Tax=Rubrivirga sp. TaxID=1885344 RepID=UPI003B52FEB6
MGEGQGEGFLREGLFLAPLFGSATGDGFGPDSDVDLVVEFVPGTRRGLFEFVQLADDLEAIVERPVDLLTRRSVERSHNPIRRASILGPARPLYRRAA